MWPQASDKQPKYPHTTTVRQGSPGGRDYKQRESESETERGERGESGKTYASNQSDLNVSKRGRTKE